MGARSGAPSGRGSTGGGKSVVEALDRLYGGLLEDFVPQRRQIAAALRKSGDIAGSREVAAALKPSRSAWALNQVARRRPELLHAVLDARAQAAAAQSSGEFDTVRSSARVFRERVTEVVRAAGKVVREAGGNGELTVAQGRRIGVTLQAVASEEDAARREALFGGRLATDVEVEDPLGGLEGFAHAAADAKPRVAPPPRDELAARRTAAQAAALRARSEDRERERQGRELEKARSRISALEREVRDARASAREAEVVAARAQSHAERARREVASIDARLAEAKEGLRKMGG